MPVYKLEEEMPYAELLKWIEFFTKRPVGWQEDQRTYLLLRAQGVKEPGENIFPSLKAIKKQSVASQENDKAPPKGKFLDMMIKAKTGDNWKINWANKDVKN